MPRLVFVAAALAVLLSACGGTPDPGSAPTSSPTPDPLAVGACLNLGASTPFPTAADVVDCGEQHDAEMLARQDVPAEYFADTRATAADLQSLQAALNGSTQTALQVKFATYARAYCALALQRVTGLESADFGEASAGRVLATANAASATPVAVLNVATAWTTQPLLGCLNHFSTPQFAATSTRVLSDELPLTERSCFDADAEAKLFAVACSQPHLAENAVVFDATALLDDQQLLDESQDVASPFGAEVRGILDAACRDALPVLIGGDYDSDHLSARAIRGTQGWGQGGAVNTAICQFVARHGEQLPAGSLFGIGDRKVTPIRKASAEK